MVTAEPAGRFTYYRLNEAAMQQLAEHFAELAHGAASAAQRRRPCA